MIESVSRLDSAIPVRDSAVSEACPFVPPSDPNEDHTRRAIAGEAAQQLFDNKNPYDVIFNTEQQLRDRYSLMMERTSVRAHYLIDRTLRRSFFAARGHTMGIHLLEIANKSIANDKPLSEENWPDEPGFYHSTTVETYKGSADRFMRTIVGMGDRASGQAQLRLDDRFLDAFHATYRRYFTSLEAYKNKYPNEDVPEVSPHPEVNWRLGRRGNGDNIAALQIAHALAYSRQHPGAGVNDIWRSSLTSSSVLSTASRIRRQTFKRLGLKSITADFDTWETEGVHNLATHPSLFTYDDRGLALPIHPSLSEANDNYCSANLPVKHTDPYELMHIETFSRWAHDQSSMSDTEDNQGLLHENGVMQDANLQMIIGSYIARTTIFPAFVQVMQNQKLRA